MLELHERREERTISYWVQDPRGAVTFQVVELPAGMFVGMGEDYERMRRELGIPVAEMPANPIQQLDDATWMALDLVTHHPDPDGSECELVENGKCSLWGGGLYAGDLLKEWLGRGRDEEFLQVRLNEIFNERFGGVRYR